MTDTNALFVILVGIFTLDGPLVVQVLGFVIAVVAIATGILGG